MTNIEELYEMPFDGILDLACSKSHVPGGGSVTAMSCALGASMGAMVCNLTLTKKGYEKVYDEVKKILEVMTSGIANIKKLTKDDMDAFDALLSAYRLPKDTESKKAVRREEIQKNTVTAALVPLKISAQANDLLFHNKRLAEIGNGGVVNDCAVACVLLESAARAAMLSVDVNFPNIEDETVKAEIKDKKEKILAEAKKTMEETLAAVESRDKAL
ncbi:MAG: cyclodeaminase/cyclohydrolase family protein [Deltaproteobacteria bacterium]|jgi:formiminotetrahydrofolate cyclodeaminase|nr:cyclodeaminase/cyclohydrolase family protein [Deltaproteobacteria bacterium]